MVALRSSSLRSASLRSTDRAGDDVFVFFMLNFLPALLCNQWYEKCLSYIGTEGAYLLVRLLWWRARRDAGFAGSARNMLAQLARIRQCRIVEHTGRAGRPRVRQQIEEIDPSLEDLGRALCALPPLT